jgi:hypothetical protein
MKPNWWKLLLHSCCQRHTKEFLHQNSQHFPWISMYLINQRCLCKYRNGYRDEGVDIRNGESVCILARRPKNLLPVQGGSSKMEFCALCLAVKKSLGNLTLVCLSLLYINEHLLFYYKGDCTLVSTWQLLQLVKEGKQAKYVKQLSNKTKINPVEHTWNHVTRCPCQPLYKLTTFNALLVA